MNNLARIDLSEAVFRKATRSGSNGGNCVEVATNIRGVVAIRDSKDQGGAVLRFTPAEFDAFKDGVARGEF